MAIPVTGAHFRAAHQLYAHVLLAEQRGLSAETVSTIIVGQRPADLTKAESVTYDFAFALVNGAALPEPTYKPAVREFGNKGTNELSHLVGVYCLVSITLNTFDIQVID
jgi:hypothetical protein